MSGATVTDAALTGNLRLAADPLPAGLGRPPSTGVEPKHRREGLGAVLAGPAALLLCVLLILPSGLVVVLSFTDYQLGLPGLTWIGADNYARLLNDPSIASSVGNTLLYTLLVAPASILGALWVAILLAPVGRFRGLFQTVFFLPVTATVAAMATAWEVVLHPSFGLLNTTLAGLGVDRQRFLSDPDLVLWTLALIGVWKTLGYNVLIYLAGLATIDRTLYEAAAVDGADRGWARFTLVTWPMLAPVTLFVTIITLIRTVSEFETVAVLTRGGPNGASEILLWTLHEEAFRFFEIGFASALAVVFLATVVALSLAHVRLAEGRRRHG